jgi:hypothetical protein
MWKEKNGFELVPIFVIFLTLYISTETGTGFGAGGAGSETASLDGMISMGYTVAVGERSTFLWHCSISLDKVLPLDYVISMNL